MNNQHNMPIFDKDQVQLFRAFAKMSKQLDQANALLMASEARYRQLFEDVWDALFVLDDCDCFVDANPAALNLLGYSLSELKMLRFMDVCPNPAHFKDLMTEVLRSKRVRDFTCQIQHKDGHICNCLVSLKKADQGVQIHGIIRDVTEKLEQERRRIELERLHNLGEVAAGITHNINNLLTGVLGPIDLLCLQCEDEEMQRELKNIQQAGQRVGNLIKRLHRAVRGEPESIQRVDVRPAIFDAVKLTRPRWKDELVSTGVEIRVQTDLDDVPPVQASVQGLHDVLVNLILNATDAMPTGGEITIKTRQKNGYVVLSVADTGMGMDQETQARVFEPFFTTKKEAGTGLGLATVKNSLTRWGGSVDVKSTEGKGTLFRCFLPIWTDLEALEPHAAEISGGRSGRVLLVDDDAIVCRVIQRMVSRTHDIAVFCSAHQALASFSAGQFDVALIDLGMSEMRGDELAMKMCQQDPALVTVLTTGWHLDETDPRLVAFDFHIDKPIEIDVVSQVMHQAIALHDRRIAGDRTP